ncbi:hypothetical protein DAEQUDRAFT_726995 [Daedalea quercina L-15889]|uniref:DUF6699 domain-containing protein n=1 Tax=Daedalea quercina L-15889 TaxID=1314783 RepID=A0A165Q7M6_9APHY|nr:hypothetical protein DAEQUDRAFT_726995 [Daedalea quercina L-15889]
MSTPRRQVRFVEDLTPTSPIAIPPRAPSSHTTSSPASSLSSAGPSTPPTAAFYHSHIIPLPPVTPVLTALKLGRPSSSASSASSLKAHLAATTPAPVSAALAAATNGGKPRLKWDMVGDPKYTYDRGLRQTGMSFLVNEPAASPDVARIVITVLDVSYPYDIVAERPTSRTNPPFVSVHDVVVAIYDNLRKVVTAIEQNAAAKRKPEAWQAAVDAHRRRAGGNASEPMRRVDFLAGRTVFLGLVSRGIEGKTSRLGLRVGPRDS